MSVPADPERPMRSASNGVIEYAAARAIYHAFKAAADACNDMLLEFNQASGRSTPALRGLAAQFMGNAWMGVMRPIQEYFPGTSSADSDLATEPGVDVFSQFLTMANQAVLNNSATIVAVEATGFFRPGTLKEITDAIVAIEKFSKRFDVIG